MKPLLLAALLFLAPAAKPADYSGSWTLDTAASTGLPSFYAGIRSHRLEVAQDDSLLRVKVVMEPTAGEAMRFEFPYRLDGREVETTTPIRTPGGQVDVPTTLKAEPAADGGVRITITRHIDMNGRAFTGVGTEDWSLAPDGTLRIDRFEQMPQGEIRAKYVFRRR